MGLILVAKRSDWYNRIFEISLACAFGWCLGGMISYGAVVGYARADDFINVYYGLVMLFVIGSLYGFVGGGFALGDGRDELIVIGQEEVRDVLHLVVDRRGKQHRLSREVLGQEVQDPLDVREEAHV